MNVQPPFSRCSKRPSAPHAHHPGKDFPSNDGTAWTTAAEGEFGNLRANPVGQTVPFTAVKARYFKFIARHCLDKDHAIVAEIGVIE